MEEKKHFLDYLEQIIVVFGVSLLMISVICIVVGDSAKGYSSMFEFGSKGISIRTIFQYLLSSVCITLLRFLFFSDVLIKKISVAKRTGSMIVSVIILIGIFAYYFQWFPVNDPKCWIAFFISFSICFGVGVAVSAWREHTENKKLESGLQNLKKRQKF